MVFPSFVASAEASGGVLDEGVYRISNFYIDGAYSSYGSFYLRANGTSVNLSTEYHADMRYDLFSYWKLEHFGSNVYLIRSMVNPNLVLNYGANGVELYDFSTGQTPTSIYFQLSAGTTKTIKPILDVNKCLTASPLTPTQSSPYYYSSVSIATADSMPFENWIFSEADISGIYLRNNDTGELKTTATVTAYDNNMIVTHEELGYTPIAFDADIAPSVTWVSSNTNVVTVSNNVSFIVQGGGQTTIIGSFTDSNGVTHTVSYILNVIIVRDMYYSEYDPNKFNDPDYEYLVYPSYGMETAHIQYRMNCYGYAIGTILYGYHEFWGSGYLQQPGEFAITADKGNVLPFTLNMSVSQCMNILLNNMQLDAKLLGFEMTEYVPQQTLVHQFSDNQRLIAVVAAEKDFHFYIQHSNGMWSHKLGYGQIQNTSLRDNSTILTNANIQAEACQGALYSGGEVKFFIVTKTAVIDFPHSAFCCYDWPCSHTQSTLYLLDQAGDYIQNSKDKTLGTNTGRIDFAKDNDVYCFTPTTTKTYTVTVNYTTGTNTDLDCKVYNECGVQIGASTTTGNVSMSIWLTAGKSYYFDIYNYTGTLTGYQFAIS